MGMLMSIDAFVLDAAEEAVQNYEGMVDKSAEFKRDRCYQALLRNLPHVPKTTVAVAIEVAYLTMGQNRLT